MGLSGPHNAKLSHLLYCTYNVMQYHLPTILSCLICLHCYAITSAHNAKLYLQLLCYDGPSAYTAIVHNSGNLKNRAYAQTGLMVYL
jgi:hypothetical protein